MTIDANPYVSNVKSKSAWIAAAVILIALIGAGWVGHVLFKSPSRDPSVAAFASETKKDPLKINLSCNKSDRTQLAMDECAGKVEQEASAVLGAALDKERSVIKSDLVDAAQKRWTAYVVAECTAYAAVNAGGSIQPFIYSECEYQQTVNRVNDVRAATRYASN